MDKEKVMEFMSMLMNLMGDSKETKPATTKFFNNDGSPANEIASSREELIHVDTVKETMSELISTVNNADHVKAIENINDPQAVSKTKALDKYGLTDDRRAFLIKYIMSVEGGYFNHPNDPGGETMWGIIKTEARAYGYNGPMKQLPQEVAIEIYLKKYWKANGLDQITDFRKALCVFDFLVNSGNRGAKRAQMAVNRIVQFKGKLQRTKEKYKDIPTLAIDGKLGPVSINAINTIETQEFLYVYFMLQEDQYEDLMRANNKLRVFDEGWENRQVTKALYLNELNRLMDEGKI